MSATAYKIPVSVLVVIHTPALDVLARHPAIDPERSSTRERLSGTLVAPAGGDEESFSRARTL